MDYVMCVACDTRLNPEQLEAFGARFLETLNHGALVTMMSLGHRAGLFEAMRDAGSLTSEALAERAGLNERYVREWLGAMTCGGIVTCDPEGKSFELPADHAAMLTDGGEGENLAHLTPYVSMMGSVEDKILRCFQQGGGVAYEEFPRFHELMERDSKQSIVGHLRRPTAARLTGGGGDPKLRARGGRLVPAAATFEALISCQPRSAS